MIRKKDLKRRIERLEKKKFTYYECEKPYKVEGHGEIFCHPHYKREIDYDDLLKKILNHLNLELKFKGAEPEEHELKKIIKK